MIRDWGLTSSGPPFHGRFYSGLIVSERTLGYASSGTFRMSCALPCTWCCCTLEPVWAPPRKFRTKSLSYVCSGLFCKPILVLFWVVVFELLRSKMLIPCLFPKWCSHTPMWIQSFLISEFSISISSEPVCISSSVSDHFDISKINSKSYQRCLFHPSQVVFVFPSSHPFS